MKWWSGEKEAETFPLTSAETKITCSADITVIQGTKQLLRPCTNWWGCLCASILLETRKKFPQWDPRDDKAEWHISGTQRWWLTGWTGHRMAMFSPSWAVVNQGRDSLNIRISKIRTVWSFLLSFIYHSLSWSFLKILFYISLKLFKHSSKATRRL